MMYYSSWEFARLAYRCKWGWRRFFVEFFRIQVCRRKWLWQIWRRRRIKNIHTKMNKFAHWVELDVWESGC